MLFLTKWEKKCKLFSLALFCIKAVCEQQIICKDFNTLQAALLNPIYHPSAPTCMGILNTNNNGSDDCHFIQVRYQVSVKLET